MVFITGMNALLEVLMEFLRAPLLVFSSGWTARSNPRDLMKYASSSFHKWKAAEVYIRFKWNLSGLTDSSDKCTTNIDVLRGTNVCFESYLFELNLFQGRSQWSTQFRSSAGLEECGCGGATVPGCRQVPRGRTEEPERRLLLQWKMEESKDRFVVLTCF